MRLTIVLLLLPLLPSCNKECLSPACLDHAPDVDLREPANGQRSYFLGYRTTCDRPDGDFELTGDTLVVEVHATGPDHFLREYLTPGSASLGQAGHGEAVEHPIVPGEGYVLLPGRLESLLFWFYGNDTLFTDRPTDVELVQRDCQLWIDQSPFVGEEIGHVAAFDLGTISLRDRTAVSCVPIFFSVDAYLIHDGSTLSMSHVHRSGITGDPNVEGWVLLER